MIASHRYVLRYQSIIVLFVLLTNELAVRTTVKGPCERGLVLRETVTGQKIKSRTDVSAALYTRMHCVSVKEVVEHWLGAEAEGYTGLSDCHKLSDLGPVTKLL